MIPPVIPPRTPLLARAAQRSPVPAPVLVRAADPAIVYGLCTVGEAGRILDKHCFTALGWHPGTRLSLTCLNSGTVLAQVSPDGPVAITAGHFFRVPHPLRRRVGLSVGDRPLLVGHPRHGLLIHPPAALEALCAASLNDLGAAR
ncbi:hypothetical protein [Nocardia puris]|uniref:hypothetical protein n=1 Tax=Nocardia puris TaxID=208602 RepID=UPI002E223B5D